MPSITGVEPKARGMRLITKRDLVRQVQQHWMLTYLGKNGQWMTLADGRSSRDVYTALSMLDSSATPDQVNAIIGNDSWTRLKCDECGEDSEAVMEVGQEPDYESDTAKVCFECLEKALTIISTRSATR